MNLIGSTPINPLIFYTGKISGYGLWIVLGTEWLRITRIGIDTYPPHRNAAAVIFAAGIFLVLMSLLHLGKSTRLGIPSENTELKTGGIYRITRNPMYLGFNLLTVSSMLLTGHVAVILLGIYSIAVYHFIIRGEERFLEERFGDAFREYRKRVRRYI